MGALGFPCFVKPSVTGSSVGVTKVATAEDLQPALETAFGFADRVLIEQAVNAREVETAVLGNDAPKASGVGEIIVSDNHSFYSYEAKYVDPDGAKTQIPADLPSETQARIRTWAVDAFRALRLSGLARIDFFVDRDNGNIYLNEPNTLPGFTAISMYPKLWEAQGVDNQTLVTSLIDAAIEAHASGA